MRPIRSVVEVAAVAVVLVAVSLTTAWAGDLKIGPADEYAPVIDPADFATPGSNPYWPMVPGTEFVYEDGDGEEHNTVTVTSDTKLILGVTCTVVRDLEWEDDGDEDGVWIDDELLERTSDWYAVDIHDNVWYFGEFSESREDKDSPWVLDGSWEAGVDGALPGILVLGSPQESDAYRQEYLEGEAEDMAKVMKLGVTVDTEEFGEFGDCMKTKEWTPIESSGNEHKYYAPGVGLVVIEEHQGGYKRIELIEIN